MSDLDILTKIPDVDYKELAPEIDVNEFKKVINSRRSVRVFTEKKIPDDVIKSCVDDALLAPNSSNLQTWGFIRVKNEEKKKELARLCMNQSAARTASELIVCTIDLRKWKQTQKLMLDYFAKREQETGDKTPQGALTYYKKIVPLAYSQGPLGIVGKIKNLVITFKALTGDVIPRKPVNKADMRVWAHKSCALACENIMLSMRAHGFDTCPMEGFDDVRVNKFLGLSSSEEVCMILACGERAENGIYSERIRMDKKLFYKEI
jgi:nitroreductase